MATLKIYQRPSGFKLPKKYVRLPLSGSANNYAYCQEKLSGLSDYEAYEIGIYVEYKVDMPKPGEKNVEYKSVIVPTFSLFSIYVPKKEGDVFYCTGNDIDRLQEPLVNFYDGKDLKAIIMDLEKLESARNDGKIQFLGQRCLTRGGTLTISQRKNDGKPFAQKDTAFQTGDDVEQKCFEVCVKQGTKNKGFYVYGSGTITTKGKDATDPTFAFTQLVQAYVLVKRFC